jgi:hypothetical protein
VKLVLLLAGAAIALAGIICGSIALHHALVSQAQRQVGHSLHSACAQNAAAC